MVATCEAGTDSPSQPLEGTNLADTDLTSRLQKCANISTCWLSHPVLWYFVMAVLAIYYRYHTYAICIWYYTFTISYKLESLRIWSRQHRQIPKNPKGLLILSLTLLVGGPPKPPLSLPSPTPKGSKGRVERIFLLMINKFISLKGLLDYLVQYKIITLEVNMCLYYCFCKRSYPITEGQFGHPKRSY